MTHSERLEREAEQTRAEVEHTLAELRARMSPGQMIERATDYLRGSDGRAFVDNLRRQVVDNPLPATLIGAGIAWLAISTAIGRRNGHRDDRQDDRYRGNGARTSYYPDEYYPDEYLADSNRPGGRDHPNDLRDEAKRSASDLGERVGETAEDWAARARDSAENLADRARDAAGSWVDHARDTAGEAGEQLRDTAASVSDSAAHAYQETRRGVRRAARRASEYGRMAKDAIGPDGTLVSVAREQPMLVAGLGLAIGAALGALLPGTRAESRVMGAASRSVRDQAMGLAEEVAGASNDDRPPTRDWDNDRGPSAKGGDTGIESEAMRSQSQSDTQSSDTQSPAGRTKPYAEAAEAGDRS